MFDMMQGGYAMLVPSNPMDAETLLERPNSFVPMCLQLRSADSPHHRQH